MKAKLIWIVVFCGLNITVFAQSRLPVHARVGLSQKMFEKPECTVSIQELKFQGKRSHSVGLIFGVDFSLNHSDSLTAKWILQSSGNVFSVPVRYSAVMPKDIHQFDRDVSWDYERYALGFEANLGLIRQSHINEKWDLRFGLSANIQDFYINPNMLQTSVVIRQNGITQPTQVVGDAFDPFSFGSTPRQKQNLQFNAVYTVGLCKRINERSNFVIDLRVCHSGQNIVEQFNFLFGDPGELKYKKSFIGIDLAYQFSLNNYLSQLRI